MTIPRTGIGQMLAVLLGLLVISPYVHSAVITSVTMTFPNGLDVPNNTNAQMQCDYQPTSATVLGVQFKAQKSGEADSGFFNYIPSPESNSSFGLFQDRATLVSATAGSVVIVVGPILMNDQSSISCIVSEGVLDSTSSLQKDMIVTAPPDVPTLSFSPSADVIMDGDDVTITCSGYGGNPASDGYIFTKKVTDASYTHYPTTTTTTDATNGIRSASYIYTGVDLSLQDAEVLCVMNNSAVMTPADSPNVTATLDIKFGPANTAHDLVDGTNLAVPIDINCSADGNPAPSYSWGQLEGRSWFTIPSSGGTLQVPANTPNGSYVFNCTASNTIGGTSYTDQAQATFNVIGNCDFGTVQTSYTVTENNEVSLHCVTTGTEQTQWYYTGSQLSNDCSSTNNSYSVLCNTINRQYNLTFNATWDNKGTYTCACFTNSTSVIVDVEVAIGAVTTSCTVENQQGVPCSQAYLNDTSMLVISATVDCTYPDPTFEWYKNSTIFDASPFDLFTSTTPCTGTLAGQNIVTQQFNATWGALGKPSKLEVLVERARAASKLGSVSFNQGLIYGFTAAKIVGLIIGVACAVGGVTAGIIGLKKTLSKNTVKPKPQKSEDTETGETDITAVST